MFVRLKRFNLALSGLIISISLISCSGGGSSGGGGAPAPQATASLSSDGTSVVFTNPDGTVKLRIPLQNQTTSSFSLTAGGNVTTKIREKALISDDRSHAGVNSLTVTAGSTDLEGFAQNTFRYYNSTGQLWQVDAPNGTAFYQPFTFKNQRLLTPDGSHILLIIVGDGNSDPVFSVYDQSGHPLFQSAEGTFAGLYQAQLSPNGKYLLAVGIVQNKTVFGGLVRVFDITAQISFDFPFDLVLDGEPTISISNDGRFQINSKGNKVLLPP